MMILCALQACGDDGSGGAPPVASYSVSGSVSHLDGGSLTISDGVETLTVAQGAATFAFTKPIANGGGYAVTVATQPGNENCVVGNGSGTISGGAVSNVAIVCNTKVAQPITVGVSAVGSLNSTGSRIFLPVNMVGTNAVTINAVLDTGSAGTVLNAFDVFPASMVTANGFVFPAGQTSITYNGITVTNVGATRNYGAQSAQPSQDIGNLGFAQLTVGAGTHVTTTVVPVLFVYQHTTNGMPTPKGSLTNLIGINPALGVVLVGSDAGSTPLTPCTPQSTSTCGAASPLRALTYAAGVDEGYGLSQVAFSDCSIATAGSCPVSNALTIGITGSNLAEFSTTPLSSCSAIVLSGTVGEPVCSQVIPSVTVSSGSPSYVGPAIFDSGAPMTRLSIPQGSTFPNPLPSGSSVTFVTPSGFSYQFVTGTGYLTTSTGPATGPDSYTNSGIGFFAQNSLLVDYSKALEGWRAGAP